MTNHPPDSPESGSPEKDQWFDWDTGASPAAPAPELAPAPEPAPAAEPLPEAFEPSLQDPVLPPPAQATESQLEPQSAVVAAQRPYTLWIEGSFRPEDRDKLLDLISREGFGIREVDLEPQWESGRVLLPRISEYAAMRVAQVLRESSLTLRMDFSNSTQREPEPAPPIRTEIASEHPAEAIPVTSHELPQPGADPSQWETVDTLIATALLAEPEWRASQTDAFANLVESLKRELRHRAYIKKAHALVSFQSQVIKSPWQGETECRVQVSAIALKKRS